MNIIKFFKSIFFLTILASIMNGCSLDYIPKDTLTDESFWMSEDNLREACNYFYTFLPGLAMNDDAMSDNAISPIGDALNQISAGTRIAPADSPNDFDKFYRIIRAANNIIEKAAKAKDFGVEEKIISRYVGEAKFFRAYGYFELVKRYGDVPFVNRTLDANAEELDQPATSKEIIYDSIFSDLSFASDNLPNASSLGNVGFGRVSRGGALALKARIALHDGTHRKFHEEGNFDEYLQIAIDASKQVIDNGQYSLYPSYFNTFQPEGNGFNNRENILVHQYGIDGNNRVVQHPLNVFGAINGGSSSPTKSLVDSYLMNDGLPIEKSPLYEEPQVSTDVFINRDPRLDATVFKIGDPYVVEGGFPPFYIPYSLLNSRVRTGYMQRKFFNELDYGLFAGSFNDFPVIRYAEVLLIYAEATFELRGEITDEELDKSINLLRERVNMPKLSNGFVENNNLDMRDMIHRERRVELALEGYRYWDLIRWKTAETVLTKTVYGSYFFDDLFAGANVSYNISDDNIIIVQSSELRKFDPSKDYLWPIPVKQLALNPNLKQNPGW